MRSLFVQSTDTRPLPPIWQPDPDYLPQIDEAAYRGGLAAARAALRAQEATA